MSQKIMCDGGCEPPSFFPFNFEDQQDWWIMRRATSLGSPSEDLHFCPKCSSRHLRVTQYGIIDVTRPEVRQNETNRPSS